MKFRRIDFRNLILNAICLRKYKTFAVPLLIQLIFSNSFAETIEAQSGRPSDVQAAINSANSGDTVLIPAGDFEFNSTVTIPGGITVMGAGQDVTVLRRTQAVSNYIFRIDCSNGGQARLSSMTLVGVPEGGNDQVYDGRSSGIHVGALSSPCMDFRIDHVTIKKFKGIGLQVYGDAKGVIDHNIFSNIGTYGIFVAANGDKDNSWNRPLDLGGEHAVFIEDNYFEYGWWHQVASQNGSRYVFRYNTINDNLGADGPCCQALDAHGKYNNGSWERGSRSYEIYGNDITSYGRSLVAIGIRGGDGVIFNNTLNGDYQYGITIMNEEANSGEGDNCGYPCKDQIRQLYIWNNVDNGGPIKLRNWHSSIIQENRDYFMEPAPNYTPYPYPHPLSSGEPLPLRINANTLPTAIIGVSYSASLTASGGTTPYQWSVSSGNLPTGIQLNGSRLIGTPGGQEGEYSFTVRVTDAENNSVEAQFSISTVSSIFSSIDYFGDASNWEPNSSNYWAVLESDGDKRYGIITSQLSSQGSKLAAYSLVKDMIFGDFTISLIAKSVENLNENGAADFSIVFGYQDDNNYYYMLFNSDPAFSVLHKIENGNRSDIMSTNMALINDNQYHNIQVSRIDNTISVKLDNQVILNAEDSTFGDGKVGIGSLNDAVYFDDINVESEATPIDLIPPNPPSNVHVSQ